MKQRTPRAVYIITCDGRAIARYYQYATARRMIQSLIQHQLNDAFGLEVAFESEPSREYDLPRIRTLNRH